MARTSTKLIWIVAILLLLCGSAYADPIVAGTTSGTFASTGASSVDGLSFTGAGFSGTSSLNLGTFNLQPTCRWCIEGYLDIFTLTVDFTSPAGTSPDPLLRLAGVVGYATYRSGLVYVTFGNVPVQMDYTGGSFDLTLHDAVVGLSGPATLTANVSNVGGTVAAADSEPVLVTALLCGGLLFAFRRRFRTC